MATMVKLVHVCSNLAVSALALVELRAQAAARLRPAVQTPVRQVQLEAQLCPKKRLLPVSTAVDLAWRPKPRGKRRSVAWHHKDWA